MYKVLYVKWYAAVLFVEMLCFLPIVMVAQIDYCCVVLADSVADYLSTVFSIELRCVHFATELLCLCEHLWKLSNSMSLSVDEIA